MFQARHEVAILYCLYWKYFVSYLFLSWLMEQHHNIVLPYQIYKSQGQISSWASWLLIPLIHPANQRDFSAWFPLVPLSTMALKEKRQDELAEGPPGYQSYCKVVQAAIIICRQDIHNWNFPPADCSPITLEPLNGPWKDLEVLVLGSGWTNVLWTQGMGGAAVSRRPPWHYPADLLQVPLGRAVTLKVL